mgnify:CR=1 FL=1
MKVQTLAALAIAAAFAAPAFAEDMPASDTAKNEKCYGVARAGSNASAWAGNIPCAGPAEAAGYKPAWFYFPAGLCTKLVGGSLEPKA